MAISWDGPFGAKDLISFGAELLERAGLSRQQSVAVAEILVEGDLLGHTTHGIQLLSPYLKERKAGLMTVEGEPEVVSDRGSTVLWDGNFLPGPWLTLKAMNLAFERVKEYSVVTIVVRRSHHIGCLRTGQQETQKTGLDKRWVSEYNLKSLYGQKLKNSRTSKILDRHSLIVV